MASFQDLMALASKRTAEQQSILAKEAKELQERERKREIEEDRRQLERTKQEKARIAARREEEAAREAKLAAERQARLSKANRSPAPSGSRPAQDRRSSSKPKASGSRPSTPRVDDPEELRRLEREAKLARAKARLFEDGDEDVGTRKRTASPSSLRPTHRKGQSSGRGSSGLAGGPKPTKAVAATGTLSARERIAASFSAEPLTRLNQNPRDRRTISEVERDMQMRKLAAHGGGPAVASGGDESGLWADPRTEKKRKEDLERREKAMAAKKQAQASASTVPARTTSNTSTSTSTEATSPRKRPDTKPRPASTVGPGPSRREGGIQRPGPARDLRTAETRSTGAGERSRSEGSRKRRRRRSPSSDGSRGGGDGSDGGIGTDIRDTIWRIVGRGRDRKDYASRDVASDSEYDSDGDMEAGADDVLFEEGRAARMARLEDKREEAALRRHAAEKKRRLGDTRP